MDALTYLSLFVLFFHQPDSVNLIQNKPSFWRCNLSSHIQGSFVKLFCGNLVAFPKFSQDMD